MDIQDVSYVNICFLAGRILVPRPGIEVGPSTVKEPNPNHWTAGEFPRCIIFKIYDYYFVSRYFIAGMNADYFLIRNNTMNREAHEHNVLPYFFVF